MDLRMLHQLRAGRKHRGLAGVLAGVILFAIIFTAGFGLLFFINTNTHIANQANLQRAGAELQSGSEKLFVTANRTLPLGPTSPLWVKAINTGGVPSTITDVYVSCQANCSPYQSGQLISLSVASPPSHFLSQSPADLNVSLPYTLNVGASMKVQINPLAFTYAQREAVVVSLLTSAGSIFSAQYPAPPLMNITMVNVTSVTTTFMLTQVAGGPQLSVSLAATALCPDGTGGCTQTFSCDINCITVTATVYNLANTTATGVSVTLQTPQVSGTASVSPNTSQVCTFAGGSTTQDIPASSQATATCQYSASTGSTGGLASFSGSATGTIGSPVTSGEAVSNSIEIGGLASVTTQGAFVANFFFLKYSSCYQNTGGNFNPSRGCTKNANPMTLANLPSAGALAAGSNFYVAFYVQITNLINTPIPILQYSYTYGDPSISGETYFFLAGNTGAMVNGVYYPNYSGTPPSLTPYPSNCNTSPTPANCILVMPGQTVTLTFAACGYGAQNWEWGGRQDAQGFDSNSGCTGNPPGMLAPEATNLGIVVSYLYNGVVDSQLMPFQGQTYIRSSSTLVSCTPSAFAAGTPTTCTATVLDTDGFPKGTPPAGTVTFSAPAGLGTLSPTSCTISFGTCSVTYTPNLSTQGAVSITSTYRGDPSHETSSNVTSITVLDPTATTITGPCKGANVPVNTQTTCTVTVTDNTGGTVSTPTGTVTMSDVPSGSGSFGTCTLSQVVLGTASCTVSYQPSPGKENPITITATYNGDTTHAGSSGSTGLTATKRLSAISVTGCVPASLPVTAGTTCTATVTDAQGSGTSITPTGGIVTFSAAPAGSGTFTPASAKCTTGAGGTCTVTFAPGAGKEGTITITASYAGDTDHSASGPSAGFSLTATQITTATTVSCFPNPNGINAQTTCTATVSDSGGASATPTGTITFSANPADGSFGSTTCTLSSGSCSVTFTPNTITSIAITGSYGGDSDHFTSSGTTSLTVTQRSTSTAIVCSPTALVVNQVTSCTITVADTGGSGATTPTGTVTLTDSPSSSGTYSSTTCTLTAGSCTVTYTPNTGQSASITLTATYGGDSVHAGSPGSASLSISKRSVSVTITGCAPNPVTHGNSATCTVSVTDTSASGTAITPTGTVTFTIASWSGNIGHRPSFTTATCTLSGGTCTVQLTTDSNSNGTGTAGLQATYNGDNTHVTGLSSTYDEVVQ